MAGRAWTEEEDRLVVETYSTTPKAEILLCLQGRTWSAIYQRAHVLFGIERRAPTSEAQIIARRKTAKNPERNKKLSESIRGRDLGDEWRRKLSLSAMGRTINETQRQKISVALRGSKRTDEQRQRMSAAAKVFQMKRERYAKRKIEVRRTDGSMFFVRSYWEAAFVLILDAYGLTWEYEPERFVLSDGRCVVPDFRVTASDGTQTFVEIKSAYTARLKFGNTEKLKLLNDERPDIPLMIVTEASLPDIFRIARKLWEKARKESSRAS